MPKQETTKANGKLINLDHILYIYINMEIQFVQGENELFGKVIGACLDKNDKIISTKWKFILK